MGLQQKDWKCEYLNMRIAFKAMNNTAPVSQGAELEAADYARKPALCTGPKKLKALRPSEKMG